MKDYKKVIIFYPMTDKLACGITFANLFKGWPAEKLAVIADGTDETFVEKQFGKGVRCIPLYADNLVPKTNYRSDSFKASLRRWVSEKFGLADIRARSDVPAKVLSFIDEFKPDVLFTPLGTLTSISFFNNLLSLRKIPVAVHIMDDWPVTIYDNRFFSRFWANKYEKEVSAFFNKTSYFLSICEAMENEYLLRYGKDFIPFFNPVEPESWKGKKNRTFAQDGTVRIVFTGKINIDTFQPLYDMCRAVEIASAELGREFCFDIYSPVKDERLLALTKNYSHCHLRGFVTHDIIPGILMDHDILFLPFSFSKHTKEYLKLSMSTNTAEYLISQTPILFYGPEILAQYDFYSKRQSAFYVTRESVDELEKQIEFIVNNPEQVKKVVGAALNVVEKECSVDVVCPRFKSVFDK